MEKSRRDLGENLRSDTLELLPLRPLTKDERPTIHYSQLPPDNSAGPIAVEWNCYRREVGRLLNEGHEGKWVLIKGEQIIGIWDSEEEADQVRLQRFLLQPVLMKKVCVWEPILRGGGHQR